MMNPWLCHSLDATRADPVVAPSFCPPEARPQAYAFAYLDDRLKKSKNNYFYCRWKDAGNWRWNWTCFPELDTKCRMHHRTQKISTARKTTILRTVQS